MKFIIYLSIVSLWSVILAENSAHVSRELAAHSRARCPQLYNGRTVYCEKCKYCPDGSLCPAQCPSAHPSALPTDSPLEANGAIGEGVNLGSGGAGIGGPASPVDLGSGFLMENSTAPTVEPTIPAFASTVATECGHAVPVYSFNTDGVTLTPVQLITPFSGSSQYIVHKSCTSPCYSVLELDLAILSPGYGPYVKMQATGGATTTYLFYGTNTRATLGTLLFSSTSTGAIDLTTTAMSYAYVNIAVRNAGITLKQFNYVICRTSAPTVSIVPSPAPTSTLLPSVEPSFRPTFEPTEEPTFRPSNEPSFLPTLRPSSEPSVKPTTVEPTHRPSIEPSSCPSAEPNLPPSFRPSLEPTSPSSIPTKIPSKMPHVKPSRVPSLSPTVPTALPTQPTHTPTSPTSAPTQPTVVPTSAIPTVSPTSPTATPTSLKPTIEPSQPTAAPTTVTPTIRPTQPTVEPSSTIPTVTPTAPISSYVNLCNGKTAYVYAFTQSVVDAPLSPAPITHIDGSPQYIVVKRVGTGSNRAVIQIETSQLLAGFSPYITMNPSGASATLKIFGSSTKGVQGATQLYSSTSFTSGKIYLSSYVESYAYITVTLNGLLSIAKLNNLVCLTSTPTMSITPSAFPTTGPTSSPTADPTLEPTSLPTLEPSESPSTLLPSPLPTREPSFEPTTTPSTTSPSHDPTVEPSEAPTFEPTLLPTAKPTSKPSSPTASPSTRMPHVKPTRLPTFRPSSAPSVEPSSEPSSIPSSSPSSSPSFAPSVEPSSTPSVSPSVEPSSAPSVAPFYSLTPTAPVSSYVNLCDGKTAYVYAFTQSAVDAPLSPAPITHIDGSPQYIVAKRVGTGSNRAVIQIETSQLLAGFSPYMTMNPSSPGSTLLIFGSSTKGVQGTQLYSSTSFTSGKIYLSSYLDYAYITVTLNGLLSIAKLNNLVCLTSTPTMSITPSAFPTTGPTSSPTADPTLEPTSLPTLEPSESPSTLLPSPLPTREPSFEPTTTPSTTSPSHDPTVEPSEAPTFEPTLKPQFKPTSKPSSPTSSPSTRMPHVKPTRQPTFSPTKVPTIPPSFHPSTLVPSAAISSYAILCNNQHLPVYSFSENSGALTPAAITTPVIGSNQFILVRPPTCSGCRSALQVAISGLVAGLAPYVTLSLSVPSKAIYTFYGSTARGGPLGVFLFNTTYVSSKIYLAKYVGVYPYLTIAFNGFSGIAKVQYAVCYTFSPTMSLAPSPRPSLAPTSLVPTSEPSFMPSIEPTFEPSCLPSSEPSLTPSSSVPSSSFPSDSPTAAPSFDPSTIAPSTSVPSTIVPSTTLPTTAKPIVPKPSGRPTKRPTTKKPTLAPR